MYKDHDKFELSAKAVLSSRHANFIKVVEYLAWEVDRSVTIHRICLKTRLSETAVRYILSQIIKGAKALEGSHNVICSYDREFHKYYLEVPEWLSRDAFILLLITKAGNYTTITQLMVGNYINVSKIPYKSKEVITYIVEALRMVTDKDTYYEMSPLIELVQQHLTMYSVRKISDKAISKTIWMMCRYTDAVQAYGTKKKRLFRFYKRDFYTTPCHDIVKLIVDKEIKPVPSLELNQIMETLGGMNCSVELKKPNPKQFQVVLTFDT